MKNWKYFIKIIIKFTNQWSINSNGRVHFSAGDIGGITIQGDKIGDAEGSWYISKSSEYLPNLKVTSGGAVVLILELQVLEQMVFLEMELI